MNSHLKNLCCTDDVSKEIISLGKLLDAFFLIFRLIQHQSLADSLLRTHSGYDSIPNLAAKKVKYSSFLTNFNVIALF